MTNPSTALHNPSQAFFWIPEPAKDRSVLWITLFVVGMHLLGFFIMVSSTKNIVAKSAKTEKIIVKTISLKPKELPVPASAQTPAKTPAQTPITTTPVAVLEEPPIPVVEKVIEKTIEPVIPQAEPEPIKSEPIKIEQIERPTVEPIKIEEKPEVKKPVNKPVEKAKKVEVKKQETAKPKPMAPAKPKKTETKSKDPEPKKVKPPEVKAPPKIAPQAAAAKPTEPKVDREAEAAKAKRQQLLAQAQQSIAKVSQTQDRLGAMSSTSAKLPAMIENLHVEAAVLGDVSRLSKQEVSYYDELASRLKLLLRLPEYGEVKIKLTLERSGKFVKVMIVSAESSGNKKYVEKTIPTLTFPSFGSNFDEAAQYTFVISLSNE